MKNTFSLTSSKSLISFKKRIRRTRRVIEQIGLNIAATDALFEKFKDRKSRGYRKYYNLATLSKRDRIYIYELGFIALYANFESFMVDLSKELIRLFPKSFKSEKIISISSIEDFKNVRQIKDFFIDLYAIEKSVSISSWKEFLKTNYGVDVFFDDDKRWKSLLILNELRNCYLHSNSKTNSKFISHVKPIIGVPIPLGDSVPMEGEKYFKSLYILLASVGQKNEIKSEEK